jgi:hypothetical protein
MTHPLLPPSLFSFHVYDSRTMARKSYYTPPKSAAPSTTTLPYPDSTTTTASDDAKRPISPPSMPPLPSLSPTSPHHHHHQHGTTSQTTTASSRQSSSKPPLAFASHLPGSPVVDSYPLRGGGWGGEGRPETPGGASLYSGEKAQVVSRTGGQLGVEGLIADGGGAQGLRKHGLDGEEEEMKGSDRGRERDVEMRRLVSFYSLGFGLVLCPSPDADQIHRIVLILLTANARASPIVFRLPPLPIATSPPFGQALRHLLRNRPSPYHRVIMISRFSPVHHSSPSSSPRRSLSSPLDRGQLHQVDTLHLLIRLSSPPFLPSTPSHLHSLTQSPIRRNSFCVNSLSLSLCFFFFFPSLPFLPFLPSFFLHLSDTYLHLYLFPTCRLPTYCSPAQPSSAQLSSAHYRTLIS